MELVTQIINRHYLEVEQIIEPLGGEIFKFGGDSCLILFPRISPKDKSILELACSRIETRASELDTIFREQYEISFSLHGSLCWGPVDLNIVGDTRYHLDYYVDGKTISRAYELADLGSGITQELPDIDYQIPAETALRKRYLIPARSFLPEVLRQSPGTAPPSASLRNAAVIFIRIISESSHYFELEQYDHTYRQIQRMVDRYGGVINKIDYTEKGYLILPVFGAPILHPDDIERAFICATRITQIRAPGVELRIGINYSNIYTGQIGANKRWEYGIIGNAVNIAARLMSYAKSRQICMSGEIESRIKLKFETLFLSTTEVKGIRDKIAIFKLVKELPEQWKQYEQRFESRPLCLRESLLEPALEQIKSSSEALITIKGATGSGKSFAAWLLCKQLEKIGHSFEIFHSDPYTRSLRLDFFYHSIRRKLGIDKLSLQFAEFCTWMDEKQISYDPELIKRHLLSPEKLSPARARAEYELARNTFFDILAAIYPPDVCLAIDPIDGYDPQSLELIKMLIKRNLGSSAKVIVTCEQDFVWQSDDYINSSCITLSKLLPEEAGWLVSAYLPLATNAVKDELHSLSEGNARFLTEILKQIQAVYPAATDLITPNEIHSLKARGLIPDRLENLLITTYNAQAAPLQKVLSLAAIYAVPFTASDLHEAFGMKNADKLMEELALNGILEQMDLRPEPVYDFSNPLLKDSIYNSILLADKIIYHKSLAAFYETHTDDPKATELAAAHYIRTGDHRLIRKWSLFLAKHYYSIGALELSKLYWQMLTQHTAEAAELISAKLYIAEIMLSLAENDNAAVELEALRELEAQPGALRDRYYALWAMYYSNSSRFPELADFASSKVSQIGDPALKIQMELQYLEMLAAQGKTEEFQSRALPLFDVLKDQPNEQNRLSGVIAQSFINQGDYLSGYKYYRIKSALATKLHDPIGKRIAASGMGNALFRRGKKDDALKLYQEALEIAERSGDRNGYSKALLNIGTFHRNLGDYESAQKAYEKSLIVARHIGNLMQESIIIYDIGELHSYLDQHDAALACFRQSLEIAERIHDESGKSFCYDAIGDNYFKRGQYAEAKATYESNLLLQQRINDREGIAHTFGNLGNIAKMDKDWDLSREYYNKQLEILAEVGDLDGSGRAWFNLAMIDLETSLKADARNKLEQALDLFTRCDASYYIEITREQIRALDQ